MEFLDEERLQADEYEKQYYGFSSTDLYEDFKEQVHRSIRTFLTEMESVWKDQLCDDILREQKLVEIYKLYIKSAEEPLQRFKIEARKILAIPRNVVLVEDKYKTDQYSDDDIMRLTKEVAELRKELLREQVFLAKCQQLKEIIDTVIKPVYEKVNCVNKFLKNLPENTEIEKKNKKVFDLHEQFMQYYFNGEGTETENTEILDVGRRLLNSKNVDDIFR